jgi:hypothetical protein
MASMRSLLVRRRPLGLLLPLGALGLLFPLGALGLGVAAATPGRVGPPASVGSIVAVQAGTIHLVQDGKVLEGGATILITDGKITASGP